MSVFLIIKCKQQFFVPFRQFVFLLVPRHNVVGESGLKRALNLIWALSLPTATYNIYKTKLHSTGPYTLIQEGGFDIERKMEKINYVDL